MGQLDIFNLSGRVAFVPGGGGAIGSALAVALAGAGAKVAVAEPSLDRSEAAAVRVRAAGSECLPLAADATKEADCQRAVSAIVERFGGLDIVVNAVGGGAGKVLFSAEEYPRDAWDWIMELNLRSTLVATQAAVRAMIAGGKGGHVLNIVSVRAQLGINAGYSADAPVGHRVGEAQDQRECHLSDLRGHSAGGHVARRPEVQGRPGEPDPARAGRRDR